MAKKAVEYPIPTEDLHKKRLGKNTLTRNIVKASSSLVDTTASTFHYTSPEGLKGIISTRELFFTDCQFLNDYRERVNINDILDSFWKYPSKHYDPEFNKLLSEIHISEYEDTDYAYMESDEVGGMPFGKTRYFVFSTSHKKDNLSMWKYYSKGNTYNGYYLQLFPIALTDEWIDRDTGVAILSGDVIYFEDEKIKLIEDAVDCLYKTWCSYKRSEELDLKIRNDFQSWVSIISLFFKDECFDEEEEKRYIASVPTEKINNLCYEDNGVKHKMYDFRVVNGTLVPFIKMPFKAWNKTKCWAIRSIGISPSLDATQKKEGLSLFLKSLDYEIPNCKIILSDIPLRY